MKNQIKTVLLLVGLSALFLWIGNTLGGKAGMWTAFVLSLAMSFGSYWFSDKIVLSMHQAKEIGPNHGSGTYEMVHELAAKANLPMPRVYIIPEWAPNAFATGRDPNHSAIAVTQGLLSILDPRELRGVLAHELGHIKNRDILISTLVAAISSAIMYLAHMMQWVGIFGGGTRDQESRGSINPLALILTVVLAPLVATLTQFAVSRTREYLADASGAEMSEDPAALASALEKISNPALIEEFKKREMMPDMQPAFSHLYIVNHFSTDSLLSWFSTHPPVKDRIKKLNKIAAQMGQAA